MSFVSALLLAAGLVTAQQAYSPPSYPSPWMNGQDERWADAYSRATALVQQMTLPEKVNITTGVGWEMERCVGQTGGVPRLGFRGMCMQDSPLGVRDSDYNSVFPAGGTIAASWDRGLWYQRGYDMGSEHRGKGVDVQLGPVVGPIGRVPEGGRNWEGFAPDPYLSGIAVAQSVNGIQDAGVVACTKHFIAYEQEHFRNPGPNNNNGVNVTASYSSNLDDKTMHELYLWPFADAVRAGTGAIMCSYNQINNSYACGNSYIMNHLLKNELSFQGFTMSDWQGQHSGVESALAGLDMSMPGDTLFDTGVSFWGANLTIGVLNGTVPEWRVNDMATRIIAAWYLVGRENTQVPINFDSWTTDREAPLHYAVGQGWGVVNEYVNVQGNHAQDIRNMAAQSTILLKNTNGALPLKNNQQFTAIFGDDAGPNRQGPNGCGDRGCDNGTLGIGWGSGTANFPFLVTPADAIQNQVINNGNGVVQAIYDNWHSMSEVQALASQASVSMVFVNSDSGEGYITVDGNEGDRNNLTIWKNGDNLINNVTAYCNNTIVVIHSPGPMILTGFNENPNVTAIVWAGMPGEQSGNSLVDVLYGAVNPSGKLPFTIGGDRTDYHADVLYEPNRGTNAPQIDFTEGVFIDYRAFDKYNIKPTYEFGFGLSYTTFSYSNLQIQSANAGPYYPTQGETSAAPNYGASGNATAHLFPSEISQVPLYIYPFLNSTNLKNASGDPDYGMPASAYLPPNTQNGNPQPLLPAGGAPGGNPGLWDVMYTVTATIKNTGSVAGSEVPQLYLSLGGPDDPKVVLRGFDKLSIQPGQSATFSTDLLRRDLSNWDTASQNWVISNYTKTVYVGSSSRQLLLSETLQM